MDPGEKTAKQSNDRKSLVRHALTFILVIIVLLVTSAILVIDIETFYQNEELRNYLKNLTSDIRLEMQELAKRNDSEVLSKIKGLSQDLDKLGNQSKKCTYPKCIETAEELQELLNLQASPCRDFYSFVCNNWNSFHPLAKKNESISVASHLQTMVHRQIISNMFDKTTMGFNSLVDNMKMAYYVCVNAELLGSTQNKVNFAQFVSWIIFARQEAWPTDKPSKYFAPELTMVKMHLYGIPGLFELSVDRSTWNEEEYALFFKEKLLGMPRDHYLLPKHEPARRAYQELIFKVMEEVVLKETSKQELYSLAQEVFQLETTLANMLPNEIEPRETTVTNLSRIRKIVNSAQFDFDLFFYLIYKEQKVPYEESPTRKNFIVDSTLLKVFEFIGKSDLRARNWQNYFGWVCARHYLPHINGNITERFLSFQRIMNNARIPEDRSEICLQTFLDVFGIFIEAEYVRAYVSADRKAKAKIMTSQIQSEVNHLIDRATWISQTDKSKSKKKLHEMEKFVAYPDSMFTSLGMLSEEFVLGYYSKEIKVWRIQLSNLFNLLMVKRMSMDRMFQSLLEPPSLKWRKSLLDVSVAYEAKDNSITIPAAILQLPFFQDGPLKFMNFGSLGSLIAKEILLGLDGSGEKEEQIKYHWDDQTLKTFTQNTQCFKGIENVSSSQENSLREKIASSGGLKIAFAAFTKFGKQNPFYLPNLEELSQDHMFYISFARTWCSSNPENESSLQTSSPEKRVRYMTNNSLDFIKSFGCAKDKPEKDVCELW